MYVPFMEHAAYGPNVRAWMLSAAVAVQDASALAPLGLMLDMLPEVQVSQVRSLPVAAALQALPDGSCWPGQIRTPFCKI